MGSKMFQLIKELFALLTTEQKTEYYKLQILVIFMSFMEIAGVASLAPFMALVGDVEVLSKNDTLNFFYKYLNISSPEQFIVILGIVVLIMLTLSAFLSMYTTWKLAAFGSFIGTSIGDRLYVYYLKQEWLFHANASSAQLVKQITTESGRVMSHIINPLLQINAKIVLSLCMLLVIITYDIKVALSGLFLFGMAYLILYKSVRKKLHENGKTISEMSTIRFRLMQEGFGGIKDILLLNRRTDFINRFCICGEKLADSVAINQAITQVPRYFMELIAFGSMISLVIYLIGSHNGDLSVILPLLSIYALAGFKLLPALQIIYANLSTIRGGISAFESIKEDLKNSYINQESIEKSINENRLTFEKDIELQSIVFTYPQKKHPVLNNLNIKIPVNSIIGLVGPSGSGKSTIIDTIMGLIVPEKGNLLIDRKEINNANLRLWQNNIGFVPQSIFLSEGTIAENVAFGIKKENIDLERIKEVLVLAHLDDFLQELPHGIDTTVGERGVQLSGGQRQRIGIARALYHEPSVLIFDEATSALDGITEAMIMQAIHDFGGKKTIIMVAHRLKTVKKCDIIFFIDKGQLVLQGTYDELLAQNSHFRKMASFA